MRDERIIVKSEPSRYTLGVVYSPDEKDAQDDWSDALEIEKACHDFTKKMQGKGKVNKSAVELLAAIVKALDDGGEIRLDVEDVYEDVKKGLDGPLGIMHFVDGNHAGDIVENYILPADAVINGESVKKGSWMMGVVWQPGYFAKILDGTYTGYSMGGSGRRVEKSGRSDVSEAEKNAAEEKYGDVEFLDEKNKKYPVDTPEHVRAAASYFGMEKNRAKYSSEDQAKMDKKLAAAKKKFDIGDEDDAVSKIFGFVKGLLGKGNPGGAGQTHVDIPLGNEGDGGMDAACPVCGELNCKIKEHGTI